MKVRSGITSKTPENVFIDAGAVYFDYGLATQRLLGATRGGNEFNTNRVSKNMEVDGAKGKVKGLERITEVNPQITVNMLELSIDNLVKAIAGATQTDLINIGLEHVGVGDNSIKEFALDHGFTVDAVNIVENSEKIYVQKTSADGPMLLQTRSKKYSSMFVGSKAANNKGFVDGLGDWALGGSGAKALQINGQAGNCLEYTPTATALVEFLTLDGANGAVLTRLVKDQWYRIQIAMKADAAWDGMGIDVACGSVTQAIEISDPADTAWIVYVAMFKATATEDATIVLKADGAPTAGVLCIDSLELEKVDYPVQAQLDLGQIGYVMNWIEGKVYFATAPTLNYDVIVSYTYTSSSSVDTTITGGEIADADYIDNVAIVGNVSGKDYPVICIVENALAEGPFSLSTAPRDEAVPVVVFTGHYLPDDLDTEPWKVKYPKT